MIFAQILTLSGKALPINLDSLLILEITKKNLNFNQFIPKYKSCNKNDYHLKEFYIKTSYKQLENYHPTDQNI